MKYRQQILPKKYYNLRSTKTHIKTLPNELFGRALRMLPIADKLRIERVSPRWKRISGKFAWNKQKILNREIVFERATGLQKTRFKREHLLKLLHNVDGHDLVELDFHSFDKEHLQHSIPQIVESIKMFPRLEKLNASGFNLQDFIDFLPSKIRKLKISGEITVKMLKSLAKRCPNLENVPYPDDISIDTLNDLIGMFPKFEFTKQKKLHLSEIRVSGKIGALSSIGKLSELKVLEISSVECFDDATLQAIAAGCQNLRRFCLGDPSVLTESGFLQLSKLPKLVELKVEEFEGFNDRVLKAIAQRGILKKFDVKNDNITDEGIQYLIDHCKSLVSLSISDSMELSERVMEAVVSEVHRRHGYPVRMLPTDQDEKEIFYFSCWDLGFAALNAERAIEIAEQNAQYPWVKFDLDEHDRDERKFY